MGIGKYDGNEMDKVWSEKNKEIQKLLTKEATFEEAIGKLASFRTEMFEEITQIVNGYPEKAFAEMPFAGADGYHSKTLAYSIWHIFRIEDIVAHEMIVDDSIDYDAEDGGKVLLKRNDVECVTMMTRK